MPIQTFKPPYYQPRLPIGGRGGNINIPAPQGSGIPEIAKIIAAGMERRQQRELEERKFALTEKYREAQISALGRRDTVSGQESLNKLYEYRRGLPEGSPAEQLIDKLIQKETAALAGEQGLDIENIPATPGVPASGQWNPFKENIAAIPPTEATQRLVPRAVGPPAPKRVTPGLEGIIKGTFDKEELKAEKPVGEKTDEASFQKWYAKWAKKTGLNPNPDDPKHKYDYRAAYKAGVEPVISPDDGKYHWDSRFKADDHPNRFIGGVDTKTGKSIEPKSEQDFMDKVADLKATDMKAARAYYNQWVKKWQ